MHPRVMAKVWAYFDGVGSGLSPVQYRGTDDERVEHLRAMGVRRFTSLSYAHKPGIAGFLNDWTRDFAERTPDTVWSSTFYAEPEAAEYVPKLVLRAGSGPEPGRHTGPGGVARVLARHPDLRLVIAHLGAPEVAEFMDLADRYANVMLDTTMAFVDFWGEPADPAIVQ